MLVGGDFNIIRQQEEKDNDNFDARWPFIFNAIIKSLDLREIVLSGRPFTWANSLEMLTYGKLYRVLASVEWEQKFHVTTLLYFWALVRQLMLVVRRLSLLSSLCLEGSCF